MLRTLRVRLKALTLSETQVRDDALIRVLRFLPFAVRPNHITVARFALSAFLFLPHLISASTALAIVAVGAIGDAADGVLARKRDQETLFGKFVDPLADKVLAVGVLYYLYVHGLIGLPLIIHMILPDLVYLLYLAGYLCGGKVGVPEPSIMGRVKVFCYFVALIMMLLAAVTGSEGLLGAGTSIIVVGIVLAWVAHVFYLYEALRNTQADRESELS